MTEEAKREYFDVLANGVDTKLMAVGRVRAAELDGALGCAAEDSADFMAAWNRLNPDWELVRQEVFVKMWKKQKGKEE